jgi:hypothetical protein
MEMQANAELQPGGALRASTHSGEPVSLLRKFAPG